MSGLDFLCWLLIAALPFMAVAYIFLSEARKRRRK